MKVEGIVKQEHIIEAAIKRFSHFGISKTTLKEIADDLGISKPSLFYYFTDKNSLTTAVARKILTEFVGDFEMKLASCGSAAEGLLNLVDLKRIFFRKYFLLAIQAESVDPSQVPADLSEVHHQARQKTIELLSSLLQRGIMEGEIRPMDTGKTSAIVLDILSAFEHCMKSNRRIPELDAFDALFDRQKEVLEMIVHGLQNNSSKKINNNHLNVNNEKQISN